MDTTVLNGADEQLLREYEVLRTGYRLNMRYWDNDTLKQVSTLVRVNEEDSMWIHEFSRLLLGTLAAHSNGLGMAANQVGLLKRLFAIKLQDASIPFVMINPVITRKSDTIEGGQEGCLSIPTIYDRVDRYKEITVVFQDEEGKPYVRSLEGLDARVVQHEIDHLDGWMFFDKMPKNPRKHVLRQWEKIRSRYE